MQEGQNRKTSSLSILAIAGVEPYQEKPGEEYMNEAQLAHFKRILEAVSYTHLTLPTICSV